MRILLEDGFSIDKGTGVGRYTENLATKLGRHSGVEVLPGLSIGMITRIRPASARRIAYAAWLETGFQRQLAALSPDVVHFTNYLVPRTRKSKARYAVSIHDLTAWNLPEALPRMYRMYLRAAISQAVRSADLVLCPSNAIRKEIMERFGPKEEQVRAAWNADSQLPKLSVEAQEQLAGGFRKKLGLQKPFILFVGTLERRKNLTTLVEAFARVAQTTDMQLVMVGRPGYGFSEIEAAIRRRTRQGQCILTGYVSDEELSLLYTLADLFAYPSLYEGFGIPLVEAMSFGLPIVASRIPASEEVAGEAALYYDDPLDATGLESKILQALGDSALRSELGSRGRQRAIQFSWEHVIDMYLDAYQSSMKSH
jgi:glycosyltransferase involved in cell wall biosynthesis